LSLPAVVLYSRPSGTFFSGKVPFILQEPLKEVNLLITKDMKERMLGEITEELKKAELVIISDYRGLNVKAISDLRRRLRQEECLYRITKNTLNRLACKAAGVEQLEDYFQGPTAIAYSNADPVAAAKVFSDFTKENEALVVKGGILSGQILDAKAIKALGEIPPRDVLLAKIVGGFQSPISGLVGVLHGTMRQLVYTVDAVRVQKESA
jgi:large subunit ribosomal protein L10